MPRKLPDLRSAPLASIKLTEPQIRALAGLMDTWGEGAAGGWSGRGSAAKADALDRRGLVCARDPQDEGDTLEVEILQRGLDWLVLNKARLTAAEQKRLERTLKVER